jgi:AraC-like DNA-binding protein
MSGYAWPYAGVCFIPTHETIKKLSGKNTLTIRLIVEKSKVVPLYIDEFLPGVSDSIRDEKFRKWQYDLKLDPGITEYNIPLSAFSVPIKWYNDNHLEEKDAPEFHPERIRKIYVQNCPLLKENQLEKISIEALHFSKGPYWVFPLLLFSGSWILLGFFLFLYFRRKEKIFIPYLATQVAEPIDQWMQIQNYLSKNYAQDLDMHYLEKELGIARHKIASLIKENTKQLFKQYLNQIRLAESKRLLTETNLPIGEIADNVGFGHISNFNRVFKSHMKTSPSEYRKKGK